MYLNENISAINHPLHYQDCAPETRVLLMHFGFSTMQFNGECINAIEALQLTDFCIGNAIKYIWRCGKKGDPLEDLQKALWYFERSLNSQYFTGISMLFPRRRELKQNVLLAIILIKRTIKQEESNHVSD